MHIIPSSDNHVENTPAPAPQGGGLIQTGRLEEAIASLSAKVRELVAPAFSKKDPNFFQLFSAIVALVVGVWKQFEAEVVAPVIKPAADAARNTIRNWKGVAETLLAEREKAIKNAEGVMRDSIRLAIRAELVNEESPLLQKLREAQKKLRNYVISLTGHPEGHVLVKSAKIAFWIGGIFIAVYVLAEMLGGFDFFRGVGTRESGFGQTVIVLMGLTAASVITARKVRLLIRFYNAQRNFNNLYPEGVDENNEPVHLHPVDLHNIIIAGLGLMFMVVGTLGLLWWRTSQAAANPLMKGTEIQAYILSTAVWILFFVELWVSPEYEKHEIEKHQKVVDEVASLEEKVGEERAVVDANEQIQAAVDKYRDAVEAADKAVSDAAEAARKNIGTYLDMVKEYHAARKNVVIPGYRRLVTDLLVTIYNNRRNRDLNPTEFTRPDQSVKVGRLLTDSCPFVYDDRALVEEAKGFNPEVTLSRDFIITEFEPVIDSIEGEVRAEVEEEEEERAAEQARNNLPSLLGRFEEGD